MKVTGKYFKRIASIALTLGVQLPISASVFAQENTRLTSTLDRAPVRIQDTLVVAVDDTVLTDIRGGFASSDGVMISFGIERVTYINGILNTTTSFNLPPAFLSANASANHRFLPENFSQIRRGFGNINSTAVGRGGFQGTFIQNSLDNQSIRATTTINAVTNTSQVMKALNFGATVRDALGAAVAGH